MASTIQEIAGYLKEAGIVYRIENNDSLICLDYPTKKYRNENQEHMLYLEIALEEDGRFFTLTVPRCYNYRELPFKDLLLKVLLIVSLLTKMIQFQFDKMSGYIRAVIEFPVEDASLTRRQVLRCLYDLADQLDDYHDMISSAANKDVLVLPSEGEEQIRDLFHEMYEDILTFEKEIQEKKPGV